ncbi:MAG: hypothetical protein ABIE68_05100 [bacterium]
MNNALLIEQLEDWYKRISEVDCNNNQDVLVEIVGIQFYGFVKNNRTLNIEFSKRLNYFKELKNDSAYCNLEKSIFDDIRKCVDLFETDTKLLNKIQRAFNNKFFFTGKQKSGFEFTKWLTIPEYLKEAKKKERYYTLIEHRDPPFMFEETRNIFNQFEKIVKLFETIMSYEKIKNADELINSIKQKTYLLKEHIYNKPLMLNIHSFEKAMLVIATAQPIKDYEIWYEVGNSRRPSKCTDEKKAVLTVISDLKHSLQKKHSSKMNNQKLEPTSITIKRASLSKSNHLIEINNGEKCISFRSKSQVNNPDKETKSFKVLCLLWDFRWKVNNKTGKIIKKGGYETLDNLKTYSHCISKEAASKQIQRLKDRFIKENVSIKIEGVNGKYRIVIYTE